MDNLSYLIANFTYLLPVVNLIGIVIGIWKYKELKNNKYLVWLLISSVLMELVSALYVLAFGSNLICLNIYTLIELGILYFWIRNYHIKENRYLDVIFILLVSFNFYELIAIDFTDFISFQIYSRSLNTLFLVVLTILSVFYKLKGDRFVESDKLFYFLLIYATLNCLFNLPLNVLVNYTDEYIFMAWSFHLLNSLVFFSAVTYTIWKSGKTLKVS